MIRNAMCGNLLLRVRGYDYEAKEQQDMQPDATCDCEHEEKGFSGMYAEIARLAPCRPTSARYILPCHQVAQADLLAVARRAYVPFVTNTCTYLLNIDCEAFAGK